MNETVGFVEEFLRGGVR